MIFLLNLTYSFAVTFKYKSAVSSPDHVVPEYLKRGPSWAGSEGVGWSDFLKLDMIVLLICP